MSENEELKGLGGWLILVGIGVVIAPIKMLVSYVPLYVSMFKDGTWRALTSVNSEAYNQFWAPLLIGEIIYNSIIFLGCTYLVYLYFTKHYLFPRLFIALMIVSLVFIPIDSWLVRIVLPNEPIFDADTTKEFARTLIGCIIWIPYILISKRVKLTFVESMPEKILK